MNGEHSCDRTTDCAITSDLEQSDGTKTSCEFGSYFRLDWRVARDRSVAPNDPAARSVDRRCFVAVSERLENKSEREREGGEREVFSRQLRLAMCLATPRQSSTLETLTMRTARVRATEAGTAL